MALGQFACKISTYGDGLSLHMEVDSIRLDFTNNWPKREIIAPYS